MNSGAEDSRILVRKQLRCSIYESWLVGRGWQMEEGLVDKEKGEDGSEAVGALKQILWNEDVRTHRGQVAMLREYIHRSG